MSISVQYILVFILIIPIYCINDFQELAEKIKSQADGLWNFLARTELVYHNIMHLEVRYYLYSKERKYPTELFENDFTGLGNSGFKVDKKTVLIIHGYTDNKERNIIVLLRKYIENLDLNVIVVDWQRAARQIYFTAVENSYHAGRQVGAFLQFLEEYGVQLSKVHIIGHSLGAQIGGVAGERVDGRLGRVTGLDPAGPMFDFIGLRNTSMSLDPTDAIFVDVLHTAIGAFGVIHPVGHADFYPNNGEVPQPGCTNLILSESINGTIAFLSKNCASFDGVKPVECSRAIMIPMGYNIPPSTRGIFYVQTNAESPHAMGGKFFKRPWPFG